MFYGSMSEIACLQQLSSTGVNKRTKRTIWCLAQQCRFRSALVVFVVLAMALFVSFSCHTRAGDEGSIRVKREQVIGVYAIQVADGRERLELKPDGTFTQDFTSMSHGYRHAGRWRLENVFLDGSAVVLSDAVTSDHSVADEVAAHGSRGSATLSQESIGELTLFTHDYHGKIALALNEVADWYYERAQ